MSVIIFVKGSTKLVDTLVFKNVLACVAVLLHTDAYNAIQI